MKLEPSLKRARVEVEEDEPSNDGIPREWEARMIPGLGPQIFGFPNSIISKLRYFERVKLTMTSGITQIHVFSANGIFDPNVTGTGHQPMYRDNWAAVYNNYCVVGSKITVAFSNIQLVHPVVCTLSGDNDSSITPDDNARMEQNNTVTTILSTGGDTKRLTQTYSPEKCFGLNGGGDGSAAVPIGSNPSNQWFYGIGVTPLQAATTDNIDIFTLVEIEYTVKFSEPVTQAQN